MYEKKTLLTLSKGVKFQVKDKPTSRRSGMAFMQQKKEVEEANQNAGTVLRHRQQPSLDLIRQLPSRNRESSTLRSRTANRKQSTADRSLLTGGTINRINANDDDELADRIYEALCEEMDEGKDVVDAEEYGTTLLRNMKHSLNMKRKVKAKLSSYNEKPKKIRLHKQLGYSIAMMSNRFSNSVKEMCQHIQLWHSHIHVIEGNFGSGVVTYFYFLRYLFYLNLLLVLFVGLFLFLPQQLYRNLQSHTPFPNTTFTGSEFLTGTGWFSGSELYYSGYTNNTVELVSGYFYNMPEAYIFTTGAYFLVTLIILAYGLASSYKKNFVVTTETVSRSLPEKIFCGWDHQIASDDAAELKHKTLFNEISIMVDSLKKDVTADDLCVKVGHFIMRLGINIIIVIMMLGTGIVVYYLLESKSLKAEIPIFGEMVVALTVTIVIVLFPLIFSTMAEWEEYKSKQVALYLTLVRTFIVQVVILGILVYFWLEFASEDWQKGCWESKLGQEMYRLVIIFFIFVIILTFISDWIRKMIAKCFPSVGRAEFDTAANTLNLIYLQMLCWLGTFFCPLLPAITMLVLVIVFYVKRYSTTCNCQPSPRPWKAAHAQTVFLSLTLLSFLLAITVISYTILRAHPSVNCGPFCHRETMYSVVLYVLHGLVSLKVLGVIIAILSTPTVVAGILLLMCITVYYLSAMASAHKEMTNLLRKQLILESKDKVFLLRWFESTMKSGSSPETTVALHQEDETAKSLGIKDIPGVGAIASGIGQVASGVSDVGSKVGQSVLKLKNVMNPIYRDRSRKDQEVRADINGGPADGGSADIKDPESADSPREDSQSQETVVTPPTAAQTSGLNSQQQMSPPGAMTPDQLKMRSAFGKK